MDSEGELSHVALIIEPRFQILTSPLSKIPLREANGAIVKMEEGKARYRFVLVNETNGGKVMDEE